MFYVYLLKSLKNPTKTNERLQKHNEGGSVYTADYKPWKLISFIGFDDEIKALEFEKYIKSGSGYAFAKKRLW